MLLYKIFEFFKIGKAIRRTGVEVVTVNLLVANQILSFTISTPHAQAFYRKFVKEVNSKIWNHGYSQFDESGRFLVYPFRIRYVESLNSINIAMGRSPIYSHEVAVILIDALQATLSYADSQLLADMLTRCFANLPAATEVLSNNQHRIITNVIRTVRVADYHIHIPSDIDALEVFAFYCWLLQCSKRDVHLIDSLTEFELDESYHQFMLDYLATKQAVITTTANEDPPRPVADIPSLSISVCREGVFYYRNPVGTRN